MKRSILGLMYLIQGMRNAGIEVDTQLASIGIKADALDPNAIIHPDVELAILNIIGQKVEPEQGLYIGQHYALAGYGPLLMLLVTCPNIKSAFENGIRFQKLTHLYGELGMTACTQYVALTYQPLDLNSNIGLLRAQCEISGTYKFILDIYNMMGLPAPLIRVELPFAQPQDTLMLGQYQQYYGADLHFGANKASFQLRQEVLNVKIPSADSSTFRLYESKCIHEMQRLNGQGNQQNLLIERIRNYLGLQLGRMPSMAETAQVLKIPERTLRYQLQQLDSSYKDIREQLIKDKALRLIEYREYSIEVIAELLGYSEPAAFNHAFKRWFGQSPRQYGK